MSAQRHMFNGRSRRRGPVAEPGHSTAAEEVEKARPVAKDEYPTEVFSMVRHTTGSWVTTAGPDSGAEVADEWEKALRGEPSDHRDGWHAHQEPNGRDQYGEGEQTGPDGADSRDVFEGFNQPEVPDAPGEQPVDQDRTESAPDPTEHDEHDEHEHAERPGAEDAHQRAETQVFPRSTDDDEPLAPVEVEPEGSEPEHHDQSAEYLGQRSAQDLERDSTGQDSSGDQRSDLLAGLLGTYPGTDARVDTAIIPRFIDDEPSSPHLDDEHLNDEHPDDEHPDDEHPDDEHPDDEHPDDEHSVVHDIGRDAVRQADCDESYHSYDDPTGRPDGAGSDQADAPDAHQRDERPGETTELISAYRDEDHREERAEPEREVRPEGTTAPEYLASPNTGPAKRERKRPVPGLAAPSPAGPKSDRETPGERTELIAAYRDDATEQPAPRPAAAQQSSTPEPGADEPGAGVWTKERWRKRGSDSDAAAIAAGAGVIGGAAAAGLAASALGRVEHPADHRAALDTDTDTDVGNGREGGRESAKAEAATRTKPETPRRPRPGSPARPRPEAPAREAAATEIFPAYPDDAEDQQQPNQARDAALAEPVAHAEPAVPDRVEAAVPALLKPPVLVAVLLVLAVLGGAGAYYLEGKASEASLAYPTVNQALIDKPATAQVTADVSRAIEAAYSYDSTELDVDENRALNFLTGSYVDQFKQNFDQVRQLGPQAKLSLQSKVSAIGVETLSDDNAKLLVMLNQIGRRNDHAQPLAAGVRLSVSAEKVNGQWKVSEVDAK